MPELGPRPWGVLKQFFRPTRSGSYSLRSTVVLPAVLALIGRLEWHYPFRW